MKEYNYFVRVEFCGLWDKITYKESPDSLNASGGVIVKINGVKEKLTHAQWKHFRKVHHGHILFGDSVY